MHTLYNTIYTVYTLYSEYTLYGVYCQYSLYTYTLLGFTIIHYIVTVTCTQCILVTFLTCLSPGYIIPIYLSLPRCHIRTTISIYRSYQNTCKHNIYISIIHTEFANLYMYKYIYDDVCVIHCTYYIIHISCFCHISYIKLLRYIKIIKVVQFVQSYIRYVYSNTNI